MKINLVAYYIDEDYDDSSAAYSALNSNDGQQTIISFKSRASFAANKDAIIADLENFLNSVPEQATNNKTDNSESSNSDSTTESSDSTDSDDSETYIM